MTVDSWVIESLGRDKVRRAVEEAARRRLRHALGVTRAEDFPDAQLRFIANGLELRVFELLEGDNTDALQPAAADAFQIARTITSPQAPM